MPDEARTAPSESQTPNLTPIKDVLPIQRTDDDLVRTRSDLIDIVEEPVRPACLKLYDDNIQTFFSSANFQNLSRGNASIGINFASLSGKNKEVAREVAQVSELPDGRVLAYINIPLEPSDTVDNVQQKAESIVSKFKKQKMTWATRYSLDDLKGWYGVSPANTPEQIAEMTELYYDPEQKLFYLSEEQAIKAKEDVEE